MKERAKNNGFEEIDDHDLPTEPMSRVIFSPFPANASLDDPAIPQPQLQERPFPQNYGPFSPSGPAHSPQTPVYPYLPPAPTINGHGRPAGGTEPAWSTTPGGTTRAARSRQSALPMLVGLFFVAVQLLLLVRFGVSLLGLSRGILWVDVIYTASSVFVLPFRLLLQSVSLPIPISVEFYTVLAILIYGLFSRLLVRFLKAALHTR